jgi:hypothetical protein
MTREDAIKWSKDYLKTGYFPMPQYEQALDMAISALEQMPEVTSTMQTGQFDYVPLRESKGISCTECKYFKVTQEPLRGTGGVIDLGQARCEKHDLIKDFTHKGQFKHLKPCEYYVDFKDGDKE